jgi:hypothetical protein
VTRRASRILEAEPGFRKQEAEKFGQTCVEQSVARIASRSLFARAATSFALISGAKPGNAIAEAPRSVNIAMEQRDLIIWGLLTCCLDPSTSRDQPNNNLNENKFRRRNLY